MHTESTINILEDCSHKNLTNINQNHNDAEQSPPSYKSIAYKLRNSISTNHVDLSTSPPNYSDLYKSTVVYINNYPGPPLEDGVTERVTSSPTVINQPTATVSSRSKRLLTYFKIHGILLILYGMIIIGLQIALLALHTVVYYYFGFWGGALLICIGLCSIIYNAHAHKRDTSFFHRFSMWQTVTIGIILGFGIVITLVDQCDETKSNNDRTASPCQSSHKVLNGILIGFAALSFLQSLINSAVLMVMKRRLSCD